MDGVSCVLGEPTAHEIREQSTDAKLALRRYRGNQNRQWPGIHPDHSDADRTRGRRIINYVVDRGTLDVAVFSHADGRLTVNGAALTVAQ